MKILFNVKGKTTGTSRQQSYYLKCFGLHVHSGLQEKFPRNPSKGIYIYTVLWGASAPPHARACRCNGPPLRFVESSTNIS